MSRILGRREFWSLPFKVLPDDADPRPDSEILIEAVLERIRRPPGSPLVARLWYWNRGAWCWRCYRNCRMRKASASMSVPARIRGRAPRTRCGGVRRAWRFNFAGDWGLGATAQRRHRPAIRPPYRGRSRCDIAGTARSRHHDPRLAPDGGPMVLTPIAPSRWTRLWLGPRVDLGGVEIGARGRLATRCARFARWCLWGKCRFPREPGPGVSSGA